MAGAQIQEPTFFILAALTDGPRHGYGIIEQVAELSGGALQLRAGTLYAALDRLVTERLIEPAGDSVVNGRTRRYYSLTDEGAGILSAEASRLETNAAIARQRLQSRPGARAVGGVA